MKRLALVVPLVVAFLAGTLGISVTGTEPKLAAHGPTSVAGTEKTAVFRVGKRTVREVRYADRETLVYSFALANEGRVPVTVTGLAPLEADPRLFRYLTLTDTEGQERFTIPGGSRTRVELSMRMHSCETLSARAGSFATQVALHVERAAVLEDVVTVDLPEEVHTGSPREASCPNATATSRPPG
ncbi:MAG TPA: hypothetical protein VK964_18260 [Nocardioidaceae bacterium]|nr:hypothetical protein [Nocardioidaceae bacterium]